MPSIPPCPFHPFDERVILDDPDRYFMQCAFNEALKAWQCGEVPIGCVAVAKGQITARAHNWVETHQDATEHAEMQVIRSLSHQNHDWRLSGVTLYVTKEPCPMCSGALYKARIPKVVAGALDPQQGCLQGALHFNSQLQLNHRISFKLENLSHICEDLLQTFFRLRRT